VNRIRFIHIAPELPPTVGGVAGYTAILSRRLVEVSNGAVEPVLVHAGKQQVDTIEVDFPVVNLSGEQSARRLAETVQELACEAEQNAVVLLEYSGYGYAKRGAPWWVARGLRRVCDGEKIPLVTTFHEISTSGPVWTSAFWLSPVQSWIARQIAQLSDGAMTTHPTGASQIGQWADDETPVEVTPAFSNVAEPTERPPPSERRPQAVIFGGQRTKTAIYETHRAVTHKALEEWEIQTVFDVGPPGAAIPERLEIDVDVRGIQPVKAISELLLDAQVGLLHYPAAYATKSGILAAYMAHGVVPLLVEPEPLGGRLVAGEHFALAGSTKKENAGRIAQQATAWYDSHAHSCRAAQTTLGLTKHITTLPAADDTRR
jgi:hypothetical protein